MAKLYDKQATITKAGTTGYAQRCLARSSFLSIGMILFLSAPAGTIRQMGVPAGDSMQVVASKKYKAGIFRKMLIGSNYRDVWSTPVTMPIFRLGKTGMKITELGGGQQTKSLRLKDSKGVEWVLRTVDKDVQKALPKGLQGTPAHWVVQDMISAAHPYAPLIVAPMAKAIGVSAPDPQLFYVPDDPDFGENRSVFAGQVVYLEKRDPTPDDSDTKSTLSVQEKLAEDNDRMVLQRQVLQARLLDMLIADWDRHADQWRFGLLDSAGTKYYYAIPRDRDQAFFQGGGLLPRVGKAVAMHHINWFKKNVRGLPKLNFKSREFDRIFLNDLDESEWRQGVLNFQQALSDGVIAAAVAKLPPEIGRVSGKFLEERLRSRRDGLMQPVLAYYRLLSSEVQVWGSEKRELFQLTPDGTNVRVQMFVLEKDGRRGAERYNRVFTRSETKTLHLEGLGGDDRFVVEKLGEKIPSIHLYGMGGNDVFELNGGKQKRVSVLHRPKVDPATANKESSEAAEN